MINLLKFYIYRAKKSKLTYILLAACALLLLFVLATELLTNEIMTSITGDALLDPASEANGFTMVLSMFANNFQAAVLSVFPILFFAIDYSTGYVKNLVGYRTDKTKLCLANLILSAAYILIGFVISAGLGIVFVLCFAKDAVFTGIGKFLLYMLVTYMETVAFTQILLLISDMLKKNIFAMVIGIVYSVCCPIMYLLIDLLVTWGKMDKFQTAKYTVLGGASYLGITSEYCDFLRSGLIAIGILIVAFFADIFALKKRDTA